MPWWNTGVLSGVSGSGAETPERRGTLVEEHGDECQVGVRRGGRPGGEVGGRWVLWGRIWRLRVRETPPDAEKPVHSRESMVSGVRVGHRLGFFAV